MKSIAFLNKLIDNIEDLADDTDLVIEMKAEAEDLLVDEQSRIDENERKRTDAFATKKDKEGQYKYR